MSAPWTMPDTTDSPAVVVAGVDRSPNSRAALAWAAEEATHRACRLHVLTAWTLPTPTTGGRSGPPSYLPDVATYQEQADHLIDTEVREVLGDEPGRTSYRSFCSTSSEYGRHKPSRSRAFSARRCRTNRTTAAVT